MDQRWQELNFRQVGGTSRSTRPTSANIAPPGVYYVFLVDDNGVPSKAAILSIAERHGGPGYGGAVRAAGRVGDGRASAG